MKKILLLSDTHGYLDEAILRYAGQADEIWHAGDIGNLGITDRLSEKGMLRAVHGNIDNHLVRTEFPADAVFELEGVKVFMTHIGGYPGRYTPLTRQKLTSIRPAIFICGHSHILRVTRDPQLNLLHLNPGAAGVHGFHKVRTLLRFQIHAGKILEMEAIELGLRSALP